MEISNLTLEITRRCNLLCDHCLRGKAQPKDMSIQTMVDSLKLFDYIYTLIPTGGEPLIRPYCIENLIEAFYQSKTRICSIHMSTNGSTRYCRNDNCIEILEAMKNYTEDESFYLRISNSNFHQQVRLTTFKDSMLKEFKEKARNVGIVCSVLDYTFQPDSLMNMGKAKNFGKRTPSPHFSFDLENNSIDGTLHINVNGDIIADCDISYDEQIAYKVSTLEEVYSVDENERYIFLSDKIKRWCNLTKLGTYERI